MRDFKEWDKMFKRVFKTMDKEWFQTPPTPPLDPNIRYINFKNKRWATTKMLITCALEMLFTGKTTLVIKKN